MCVFRCFKDTQTANYKWNRFENLVGKRGIWNWNWIFQKKRDINGNRTNADQLERRRRSPLLSPRPGGRTWGSCKCRSSSQSCCSAFIPSQFFPSQSFAWPDNFGGQVSSPDYRLLHTHPLLHRLFFPLLSERLVLVPQPEDSCLIFDYTHLFWAHCYYDTRSKCTCILEFIFSNTEIPVSIQLFL